MKSEIAGKILSEVKGDDDVNAAVANELNATKTRRPYEYRWSLRDEQLVHTWNPGPKSHVEGL